MYDELEAEIAATQRSILAKFDALDLASSEFGNNADFIKREIVNNLNSYTDARHPTNFLDGTLDDYLNNKARYHFVPYDNGNILCVITYDSLPELYQDIIKYIAKEFTEANGYTKQDLRDYVIDIAKSSPIARFDLKTKKGKVAVELYTPEEKFLAIDCLKAIIPTFDLYNTWREKVKKTLSDPKYAGELQHIYDEISGSKGVSHEND